MKNALLFTLCLFCTSCATNTVYVPDGKAVRLRQDVRAKIWAMDANGNPVAGAMTLKEGWYVLPMPEEK
jgi:hypothetical protein